jgi:hypothetical protein
MILSPSIEGILPLRSSPVAFIPALRDRVASGLLGKNLPRAGSLDEAVSFVCKRP